MRTVKDIEAYLGRLNRQYTAVDTEPGTYLIHSANKKMPPIAMRVDAPLVLLRMHIGDVAKVNDATKNAEMFRRLLQLNAKALVHASFGLEDDRIVLSSALELENLDFNELEAVLDEFDLTLAQQVPSLAELSKKKAGN